MFEFVGSAAAGVACHQKGESRCSQRQERRVLRALFRCKPCSGAHFCGPRLLTLRRCVHLPACAWWAHQMAEGFAEASEPVVGGGVSLSLPVNMLEELESLTDVLSLHTCVLRGVR